jgi:hypothetical protein
MRIQGSVGQIRRLSLWRSTTVGEMISVCNLEAADIARCKCPVLGRGGVRECSLSNRRRIYAQEAVINF